VPRRPVRVRPPSAVAGGVAAIATEFGLPDAFPADVLAEAQAAAAAWRPAPGVPRLELPFVTIDPPGSRDLDQALHLERRADGHRVTYAIADVAAFVAPGGAVDREAHARATTVYLPGLRLPLHPPVLSEGAASLLPGEQRPAFVWTLDLDATGALASAAVHRAVVRSVAQYDYAGVPEDLGALLAEVGERRLAQERARGGVSLRLPEQEVVCGPDGWTTAFRAPLATEEHNAQVSLLTGMAAAQLMTRAGAGLLRSQGPPDAKAQDRLRGAAAALGAPWPQDVPYAAWVRTLDPSAPAHAALLHQAATSGRGAGYVAFDGEPPPDASHFAIAAPYAHATAPLRRLADRHVLEACAAVCDGRPVPRWVRDALPALPGVMAAGAQRAAKAERAAVDLVEATLLQDRVGQTFEAVAIDDDLVQLHAPAVRERVPGGGLQAGATVTVRLDAAEPATRTVRFSTV